MNTHTFESRADMQAALCNELALIVQRSLFARSQSWLALAGGSTPLPIYAALAKLPYDWAKVTAISTDERWVSTAHSASNVSTLKLAFAGCNIAINQLVPESISPGLAAEANTANALLAKYRRNFDAMLLGMGEDGHFASLFPSAPAVLFDPENSQDAVCITPDPLPPEAPFARISLSMSRILRSDRLFLCITGERKLAVLKGERTNKLPIDHLIAACVRQNRSIDVYWSP